MIPAGVVKIGSHAFVNCKSLKTVTLPKSVKEIGEWAFSDCESLKEVRFKGSQKQWKAIKIGTDALPDKVKITYNVK